jgi:hypothetical protein
MQDLTTGPVTRHLLKTASFMLVTMVFQTLYFPRRPLLGRPPRQGSGRRRRRRGQSDVPRARRDAGAWRGHDDARVARSGRKEHDRALLVFNQSLVLSVVIGATFFVLTMAVRNFYANALSADAETARLASGYLLWFLPAIALQFPMVAMGAALRGTGTSSRAWSSKRRP